MKYLALLAVVAFGFLMLFTCGCSTFVELQDGMTYKPTSMVKEGEDCRYVPIKAREPYSECK